MIPKNTYYLNFNADQFLAAKELLKSMPVFYNRTYFTKKFADVLWYGDNGQTYKEVSLVCKLEDIVQLRNIIKTNFLHIANWDSLKYFDENKPDDYGFTFIAGNIKFILMPFTEIEGGYLIKSFNPLTGMCYKTKYMIAKEFFLKSQVNERGDFIKTTEFNIEDIQPTNSEYFLAPKLAKPETAVYSDNRGYLLVNTYILTALIIISILVIFGCYFILSLT